MPSDPSAQFLWFAGGAALLAMLVRTLCERMRLPAQVGYLVLGLGIRFVQEEWQLFHEETLLGLEHLAELGIVCLLFHVGLRSNPRALAQQLPKAAMVWISDVLVSAGLGYAASRWLLGLDLVPSLFVAAALSATSVGVSLLSWEEAKALHTKPGGFLLDLAELDDLSAVLLLVLLLGAVPALTGQGGADLAGVLGQTGTTLLWLGLIGLGAFLFSRYLEVRVTGFFERRDGVAAKQVVVLGCGLVIAGLVGLAGFSAAVGAMFAGLAFSRDPQAVRLDAGFAVVYGLFTPFFFLSVGFAIDPSALGAASGLGVILVLAAIAGKALGAGLPSWRLFGPMGAVVLGASMVPRAEIAMVVARRAQAERLISEAVYAGLVTVSAVTCLLTPVVVRYLLARWRPPAAAESTGGS